MDSQTNIDQLVGAGEEAIAGAKRSGGKKRPAPGAGPQQSPEAARAAEESKAAREARLSALSFMFSATGRVVLNGMLKLQPPFSDEQGKVLAEAWLPLLDSYTQSPLGVALTVTGGVLAPYLMQLFIRQQQAAAERAAQDANGRPVQPIREVATV